MRSPDREVGASAVMGKAEDVAALHVVTNINLTQMSVSDGGRDESESHTSPNATLVRPGTDRTRFI
jgi:hypothetical protein